MSETEVENKTTLGKEEIEKFRAVALIAGQNLKKNLSIKMPSRQGVLEPWSAANAAYAGTYSALNFVERNIDIVARDVVTTALMDSLARGNLGKVKVHCNTIIIHEVVAKLRSRGYDAVVSSFNWRIVIDLNNLVQPDGTVTRVTDPPDSPDDEYDSEAEMSD